MVIHMPMKAYSELGDLPMLRGEQPKQLDPRDYKEYLEMQRGMSRSKKRRRSGMKKKKRKRNYETNDQRRGVGGGGGGYGPLKAHAIKGGYG